MLTEVTKFLKNGDRTTMGQTRFLRIFPMKALTVALMSVAALIGVACAGGSEVTPAPAPSSAPTPAPTSAPTPAPAAAPAPAPTPMPIDTPPPSPADHVAEGRQLYLSAGCAVCHGQNAEGTDIAMALPGHSEEQVKRQVRNPVGNMPRFSPEKINLEELEMIADYIESLAPVAEHREPVSMKDTLVVHHWMALSTLEADNEADAEHHASHILDIAIDPEHKAQMEEALQQVQAGKHHDASHAIEEMLVGKAALGLSLKQMHVKLSLAAFGASDVENAKHHLEHFIDGATGDEKARGEKAIGLLEQGNIHDAEHEIGELLEAS